MKVFNKMKVFNDAKKYRLYLGDDLKVRVSTKHGDYHADLKTKVKTKQGFYYAFLEVRLITYRMLSERLKRVKRLMA